MSGSPKNIFCNPSVSPEKIKWEPTNLNEASTGFKTDFALKKQSKWKMYFYKKFHWQRKTDIVAHVNYFICSMCSCLKLCCYFKKNDE